MKAESVLTELATLRRANRLQAQRLARAGESRRAQRIERMVSRAYLDAAQLLTLHVGGGEVVREATGLPQRRWAHAVALLRLAGLAHGRTVRLTPAETPEATLEALQAAAERARAQPWQWGACMAPYNRPALLHKPRRNVAPLEGRQKGRA